MEVKRKNLLVWILALGTFGVTNTEMGIMGILPIVSQQFHVTIATAGELVSYFAFIIAVSGLFLPALLSRFDKKKIMLLSIGLFVFSCLASVFIKSFSWLLIVRLIPAFLHPVFVSYAMSLASSLAKDSAEASRFVSKIFMGVSAGMVLGVPLATMIANYGSFQLVMLTFALINALIFLACAIFMVPLKEEQALNFKDQMKTLFKLPTLLALLSIILLNGAVFSFYSYLSDFLGKVSLLGSLTISFLLFVYGLANVLGNWLAGQLLALKPQMILFGLPLVMFVPYVILYFVNQNLSLIFVLILVLGTFAGMEGNLNQFIMNKALSKTPDLANGLFITGANLGTTVGSAVAGQFIVNWGTKSSLIAPIIFLSGAILIILMSQRKTV